jgi:hypothetical protein
MHVVINGHCEPMTVELGNSGNYTYTYSGDMGSAGCHEYYFLAYDAAGGRATYPEIGSYRISAGEDCPDGEFTTEQAPADCEDLQSCGDGDCEEPVGENCSSCPEDCGRCPCIGDDCGGTGKDGCGCRAPGRPLSPLLPVCVILFVLLALARRRGR